MCWGGTDSKTDRQTNVRPNQAQGGMNECGVRQGKMLAGQPFHICAQIVRKVDEERVGMLEAL